MNLHLMSPIGNTGYGYVGLNLLTELSKNHDVGLSAIGHPNPDSPEQISAIQQAMNNTSMIPNDSPALKIWHQFDLLVRPGKGKYFAFPFFEVDSFNDNEKYHLNSVDEIIVSCSWAKKIIENQDIEKPVHIVPMGVDLKTFDYKSNQPNEKYVFFTIGKWEKRKAHDTILHCFNQAFTTDDNVELWMVTSNPFLNQEEEKQWLNIIDKSPLRDKIKPFPRLPNHQAIAQILSYASCGVYISRGEGWNMELLESMAMNKPVIASNYSAHTEYCTEENSFLVDMPDVEPAIDNKWFFGTSNWGKIGSDQIEQTISHMKYCYENNIRENPAGLKTAESLSWKNSAHQLLGCMS